MIQRSTILSQLIQEGFEQGHEEGLEKGREQGREEGERKATLEVLHEALEARFKLESGKFDKQFEWLEVAPLKKLIKTAWTVQTLKEFQEALADMLAMQLSPFLKEVIYQLAFREGFELGERKVFIEALYLGLSVSFKVEPGRFDEQFEQLDIVSLKKLHTTVLTVQTLEEFKEVLADMLSKASSPQSSSDQPQW